MWRSSAELAADMRMPPSTLRHRLRDEGQSYAAIKDDIRRDLAVELLLNTTKTIGEIAVQLGYSEPSAFFRAFRKWMDKSPEAFRRDGAEIEGMSVESVDPAGLAARLGKQSGDLHHEGFAEAAEDVLIGLDVPGALDDIVIVFVDDDPALL